jgi:two-component system, cell cycle sensor histidine kinase and response regulator CckA
MTTLSLERKVQFALAFALLLLSGTGVFAYFSVLHMQKNSEWVNHTLDVIASLRELQSGVYAVESAGRAYAITGIADDEGQFASVESSVQSSLSKLSQLTADNPAQRSALAELHPILDERLAHLEKVIDARRQEGFDSARALVITGEGVRLQERIRGILTRMEDAERILLVQRDTELDRSRFTTLLLLVGGSLLGLLSLGAASIIVAREVRRARGVEATLAEDRDLLKSKVNEHSRELVRTSEFLQSSEGRLASIIASAMDGIISVDEDQSITLINEAAEAIFAYAHGSLLGKPLSLLIPDRFRNAHRQHIQAFGQTRVSNRKMGELGVIAGLRSNGEEFPLEASISQVDARGRTVYTVILRDITERKRSEEALAKSQEQLYLFVENAPISIAMLDPAMRYVAASRQWIGEYGNGRKTLNGVHHYELHPGIPDRWREAHRRGLAGEVVKSEEDAWTRGDGSKQWLRWAVHPWRDNNGLVGGIIISAEDITERKRAEEELHRFISFSPAVLYALRLHEGRPRLSWCSENLNELTGFRSWEAMEEDWWEKNVYARDRTRVFEAHPTPYDVEHQVIEYRFHRKDGRYFWLRDEKRLLRDEAGHPTEVVGTWSDITDRVRLEEQLRQSQKMEAIGKLAGGIAHDFNNLLTVISGYSDMVLQKLPATDPNHDFIKAINEAGNRAGSLTQQLLAFSRQTVLEPKVLDVNVVIAEMERMLNRLIGENILLAAKLDPGISRIKVDPGHLGQVLMNLVVNARDAMLQGGKLSISTASDDLDVTYEESHPGVQPGRYVMVAIADTGQGMSPDVKARLFEPFFTTKEMGKGTGLGLAVVHGIVKQSGGHIEVYSEQGMGTTFKVYFPAVDDQLSAAAAPVDRQTLLGREIVLLVEDERLVRELALLTLKTNGYTVLEAGTADEAIRILLRYHGDIDLLATDIVLPGGSGPELAMSLRKDFPKMKILYMSGYTNDAVVRHGILDAEVAFLQKPYTPQSLLKKVRTVLDSP